MRRVALALTLTLVLALCVPAARPATAAPHDSLTIGMVQFPPDMHPYITNTSIKEYISLAARRPVTGFTARGEVICILCTEVPSLANGRARVVTRADGSQGMEVLFTLRSDLFWADGQPVTAKDSAFAFQVSQAFAPSPTIDAVEAVDAHTIRVHLKRVRYDFDRSAPAPISEHIEGPIFRAAGNALDYGQKSAFNRHPEEPGLWFGPYRVAEFKPNQSVTLVPNSYWKGDQPHFRKVTMRLIENTSALQANLLAGDVDIVAPGNLGLTLDQVNALARTQKNRFDFTFIPAVASYEHLALNLDNRLLADKRVRHALSMAIDRKTITARLFESRLQPAYSFLHPTQFGWDPSIRTWPYDPEAARRLLDAAGFKPGADGIRADAAGNRLSLEITTTAGNRVRELVEQVLQTEFKAIGVELAVHNQPARVMFGQTLRRRQFSGIVEFQSDPPLNYVPIFALHSDWIPREATHWSGQNYSGFRDAAMDQALDAAWAELDPARRKPLWRRILSIYADEMPEIPLYFGATAVVTPKWLTGLVRPERFGGPTNWIEDWRPR